MRDEIIRMMKEAGFYIGKDDEFEPAWERFAALVRADTAVKAASIVLTSPSRDVAVDEIERMAANAGD